MAAVLVCRAASSPFIHLGSRLIATRCLPFSTTSANSPLETSHKSPLVAKLNFLENEFATYSNEVVPLLSGFPFELHTFGKKIEMERIYLKENISVVVRDDTECQINGDDQFIPLHVDIKKGNVHITSEMTSKPDRFDVHEVTVRDAKQNIEDFNEYLETKGLMSKTVSLLYDQLGFKKEDGMPLKA